MSKSAVIKIDPAEVRLKRKLRQHLGTLGFRRDQKGNLLLPDNSKENVRRLHGPQRDEILRSQAEFIRKNTPKIEQYFASGKEVDPAKISARLERVESHTWQGDLFRLATLTWAVPVSSGFGRRLRFLVWDDHNGKLIGVIAIGDPVFNLAVRDNFIGWSGTDRASRLVNIMDAYVLGAVPPYNMLLGGKLVACLVRSLEIYKEFQQQYRNSTGIISQERKSPRLLAVTTSSSMGRSSVYNRLKLNETTYMQSIGYSGGWGHFHVPDELFHELRAYLRNGGHRCADLHGYGQGPNWRIRVIRAALSALGFKGDLLKHGIQREVFISLLADNAKKILSDGMGRPRTTSLKSVTEISSAARERWLLPRSARLPDFRAWERAGIEKLIFNTITANASSASAVQK
jgi:SAM-dependent methyltransferase